MPPFQLPKIDLADAKIRVLIIVVGVVGFVALIYLGRYFFTSAKTTTGPSKVAKAPGNLQSVPGGQLTPEYYRALVQANAQAAKQAQISGGSAVPTLLNQPGEQPSFQSSTPSCNVVCPTDNDANVENDINDLVKSGKLSAEEGKKLADMAKQNVSVSHYAAQLDQLVKQGKLTPDQARKLLDTYKKQHANKLAQESGAVMDSLIKSGQLPLDSANELLELQKKRVSPAEYAEKLNQLVREGKISPQTAQQLLAQYSQQHARESSAEAVGQLEAMAASGQIKPEVAKELAEYQKRRVPEKEYAEELEHLVRQGKLTPEQARRLLDQYRKQISPEVADELGELQKRNVPVEQYAAALQKLVAAGKITPEQARQMEEQYRRLKTGGASEEAMADIVRQAEKENQELLKQLPPETAQKLADLQRANVPVDEYKKQLEQLVKEGKITPQQAEALLGKYQELYAARGASGRLEALRANNASVSDYAEELSRSVANGAPTAEQANRLLKEYQASQTQELAAIPSAPLPDVKGAPEFAALQKRIQSAAPTVTPLKPIVKGTPPAQLTSTDQLGAAQAKAKALAEQQEQQRLQALMNAMSQQANQLVNSWQPPVMSGQVGSSSSDKDLNPVAASKPGDKGGSKEAGTSASAGGGEAPIIKAGTIIYAILDTAVNSDFPDSPVLATIVSGKYKGAKLLGKLAITQGQDRLSLTFKLMNLDEWPKGKTINAYAIDPDTAKTVLASEVNYHYFLRYGGLFASSFLTGYAQAISTSGATTSLSVTGSTTTNPVLSPSSKFMSALGNVGQAFGKIVQGYSTTPPTVKIDPGVSLGILFMADVSA